MQLPALTSTLHSHLASLALWIQEGAQGGGAGEGGGADPGQGTGQGGGGLFDGNMLIPMALIFVIFYVLMIGPDRKRRKQRETMLAGLKKGTKVMTNSGLYGTITQVQEGVVTLQVADGVRLRFALHAIQDAIDDSKASTEEAPEKAEAK